MYMVQNIKSMLVTPFVKASLTSTGLWFFLLCSRVHAATIFIIALTMKDYKYQLHHLISPPDFELFKDGIYAIVHLCNPDEYMFAS